MPEDSASLIVFLASDAAAGITGQAIGIGGDRLSMWSHSGEVAFALRDGGWSPEDIAESWEATLGGAIQPFGVTLPPLDLSPRAPRSTDPSRRRARGAPRRARRRGWRPAAGRRGGRSRARPPSASACPPPVSSARRILPCCGSAWRSTSPRRSSDASTSSIAGRRDERPPRELRVGEARDGGEDRQRRVLGDAQAEGLQPPAHLAAHALIHAPDDVGEGRSGGPGHAATVATALANLGP